MDNNITILCNFIAESINMEQVDKLNIDEIWDLATEMLATADEYFEEKQLWINKK